MYREMVTGEELTIDYGVGYWECRKESERIQKIWQRKCNIGISWQEYIATVPDVRRALKKVGEVFSQNSMPEKTSN